MFQLRAKTKQDGKKRLVRWLIHDMRAVVKGESIPEELTKAAKELWHEKAEHWQGIGNGIVADVQGVAAALEKVDDVVRRFEGKVEAPPAKPTEAQQPVSEAKKTEAASTTHTKGQGQQAKKTEGAAPVKQEPDVVVLD